MPKQDILSLVAGYAEKIVKEIQQEADDQQEGVQMLSNIKMKAQGIIEQVAIMKKYREIRNRSIYIYYPEDGEYSEATRAQKIKIARRFLMDEGKI